LERGTLNWCEYGGAEIEGRAMEYAVRAIQVIPPKPLIQETRELLSIIPESSEIRRRDQPDPMNAVPRSAFHFTSSAFRASHESAGKLKEDIHPTWTAPAQGIAALFDLRQRRRGKSTLIAGSFTTPK